MLIRPAQENDKRQTKREGGHQGLLPLHGFIPHHILYTVRCPAEAVEFQVRLREMLLMVGNAVAASAVEWAPAVTGAFPVTLFVARTAASPIMKDPPFFLNDCYVARCHMIRLLHYFPPFFRGQMRLHSHSAGTKVESSILAANQDSCCQNWHSSSKGSVFCGITYNHSNDREAGMPCLSTCMPCSPP